jgi:hypothetical protein
MMDLNGLDIHILHQRKQGMFCQSDISSTDLRVLRRHRLAATPLPIVLLSVLWINSECWSLWVDQKMFRIWCMAIGWSKKWRCVTIGRPDDRTSSSSSSQHAVLSISCLFGTAGQRELIEDRSVGDPGIFFSRLSILLPLSNLQRHMAVTQHTPLSFTRLLIHPHTSIRFSSICSYPIGSCWTRWRRRCGCIARPHEWGSKITVTGRVRPRMSSWFPYYYIPDPRLSSWSPVRVDYMMLCSQVLLWIIC